MPSATGWPEHVAALARRADGALQGLARWLDEPAALLVYRPAPSTWTAREIVEHVTLTNHYLFVLIDKIARRSQKKLDEGSPQPDTPARTDHLAELARRELRWSHPEHMTPHGEIPLDELRRRLRVQADRCRERLAAMPAGEGALHRIRMSVVPGDDDRLDLYQFIEVVVLHAERHLRQMERNRDAWIAG